MLLYDEIHTFITTYLVTGFLATKLSNVSCILIYALAVYLFLLICKIGRDLLWR